MAASVTAEYVAMYRALETSERRREPLFRDPFAAAFLTGERRLAARLAKIGGVRGLLESYADRRAPGARSSAIGRTRFIDDVVRRELARGTRQLVVLGAGFDCRAHRLVELRGAQVFEVDRPDTQAVKRERLAAATGALSEVVYVPVDFLKDDLGERLVASGWSSEAPTLFIWEGVTNYLDEPAVARVLERVGKTAKGGAIVFTYIHRGVLDGSARFEGADKLVSSVAALGEPWRFGLLPDQVEPFVARFGLSLEDNLGADDYRRRYLGAADLKGYAFYRIAVARVG